jgi:hypothetical protein
MFCKRPLLDAKSENIQFGNATAKPIEVRLTIHHQNGNHSDNSKRNRAVVHETCHKKHHANIGGWRKHETPIIRQIGQGLSALGR